MLTKSNLMLYFVFVVEVFVMINHILSEHVFIASRIIYVNTGNDQEKAQSERNSLSKSRCEEKTI